MSTDIDEIESEPEALQSAEPVPLSSSSNDPVDVPPPPPTTSNFSNLRFCVCDATEEDHSWCIQCDQCDQWFHGRCVGLATREQQKPYTKAGAQWFCNTCRPSSSQTQESSSKAKSSKKQDRTNSKNKASKLDGNHKKASSAKDAKSGNSSRKGESKKKNAEASAQKKRKIPVKKLLDTLAKPKKRWNEWKPKNQYRIIQTKQEDQGACTPKWLLAALERDHGKFHDPCPHISNPRKGAKRVDGLKSQWHPVNYINPPFNKAKEWFEKGLEQAKKGCHCIFLVPASRIHRKYFETAFEAVSEVQILSQTIAFEGYPSALPHALMLMHLNGHKTAKEELSNATQLHLMTVPSPGTFEQVRAMVRKCGYEKCYVLGSELTKPLEQIVNDWKANKPYRPMAVLFPSRLECRVVHSDVLKHAIGLFACMGTLSPTANVSKVWSPSILAVFGPKGPAYKALVKHEWVSKRSVPITSYAVQPDIDEYYKTHPKAVKPSRSHANTVVKRKNDSKSSKTKKRKTEEHKKKAENGTAAESGEESAAGPGEEKSGESGSESSSSSGDEGENTSNRPRKGKKRAKNPSTRVGFWKINFNIGGNGVVVPRPDRDTFEDQRRISRLGKRAELKEAIYQYNQLQTAMRISSKDPSVASPSKVTEGKQNGGGSSSNGTSEGVPFCEARCGDVESSEVQDLQTAGSSNTGMGDVTVDEVQRGE